MLRIPLGFAAAVAAGLALGTTPALALQAVVTQVDANSDGSMTYHFAVRLDPGETLVPGNVATPGDFVTVYNFYGLIDGSAKSPPGWAFSSEQFGRTPMLNGYPLVLPVDVPNTPNLTWAVTQPVTASGEIAGFSATTRIKSMTQGEYAAQATRPSVAIQGAAASAGTTSKQAVIGLLQTPSFLADSK